MKFLCSLSIFIQLKRLSSVYVYLYATRTQYIRYKRVENATYKFETRLGHIVYAQRSFDFN